MPGPLETGRALFAGHTACGDAVTFVCFDDGYGVRRNGVNLHGWLWPADQVDEALAAYRKLAVGPGDGRVGAHSPAA